MELINTIQSDILTYLGGWFGFLTVSQLQVLTGGKSAGYLREMLGSLSRRGYIKSYRVEISYKVRAENMYFILPKGRELLIENKLSYIIARVSSSPVVIRDFFHRLNTVWGNIAAYQYATAHNIPILELLSYFDKQGSVKKGNLTSRTQLPVDNTHYIPDSIIRTERGLYLCECYADKDSKRILASIATHARALAQATPSKAFGLDNQNARVLCSFLHPGIKQAVVKRLQENDRFNPPMSTLFFFASIDEIKADFGSAWKDIHNTPLVFT